MKLPAILRRPAKIILGLTRAPLERYCVSKLPRRGKPAPKRGRMFQAVSAVEFQLRNIAKSL